MYTCVHVNVQRFLVYRNIKSARENLKVRVLKKCQKVVRTQLDSVRDLFSS